MYYIMAVRKIKETVELGFATVFHVLVHLCPPPVVYVCMYVPGSCLEDELMLDNILGWDEFSQI